MRYDPYIIGMCVQLGGSECVRMSKSEAETEGTENRSKARDGGRGGSRTKGHLYEWPSKESNKGPGEEQGGG